MIRAAVLSFLGVVVFAAPALANQCTNPDITISAPPLSGSDQRAFVEKFRTELTKVCTWWDGDFTGPYRIEIEDSRGTSMALIPAWRGNRGQVIFRMRTIRQGNSPITHEIVHAVAPNGNRFLAEGLASHAHDALGGQAAFPNFGNDLHTSARKFAADADMPALDRLATPTRLQLPDLQPQGAYLVAGSFVRYLIETHGMEKFRALYAITPLVERGRFAGLPRRWNDIYGMSFEELVDAWRTRITG
ncbi:MAG: hypothetical protein HOK98_12940 [Rhodospirillaceae bacterium]|jgi:hypothetical protein|nr:hypothetical protein [Rhodospirillaceae bacterium]MBT5943690.1 hypothetical protein [Rhodospirillaceae bacterium]MBT6404305.1 hypothetical protein [Rhodospirillaceae bacterium]MBT6537080.1 hypothetical protein [Rhodospirillaceae bacterium]MBT7363137.1 hypothetical protein [Rhodospirillaceae bacterium]